MKSQKAVVLLSGGLDSLVSLGITLEEFEVSLVLLFNYGQRSFEKERMAVERICKHYNLPFKQLDLEWLKEITTTSLVNVDTLLPEYTVENIDSSADNLKSSAKAVWVPNRNGVMLNIAAAFAESLGCEAVVFGANAEEASTFPDNSKSFADKLTESLSYSTSNGVRVYVPLAEKTKSEIVAMSIEKTIPLEIVWSCYARSDRHCGKCESCVRLKRALLLNGQSAIWERLI